MQLQQTGQAPPLYWSVLLQAVHDPLLCHCSDPQERLRSCMRLISKMPTLAAIAYKFAIGENLLHHPAGPCSPLILQCPQSSSATCRSLHVRTVLVNTQFPSDLIKLPAHPVPGASLSCVSHRAAHRLP